MEKTEEQPFYYVRWTWWSQHKPDDLVSRLEGNFKVSKQLRPDNDDLYLFKLGGFLTRYEIWVEADTLFALLSRIRAFLFQKKRQPFTSKDKRLKDIIFKLYRHDTASPFTLPGFTRKCKEPPIFTA